LIRTALLTHIIGQFLLASDGAMLAGRLKFYTVLAIFTPQFWRV
jgi:hypothetical protein